MDYIVKGEDYDRLIRALQAHGPAVRSPLGIAVHTFLDECRPNVALPEKLK